MEDVKPSAYTSTIKEEQYSSCSCSETEEDEYPLCSCSETEQENETIENYFRGKHSN